MEAYSVVRRSGSHIFWTVGSQMVKELSVLLASHASPPPHKKYSIILSITGEFLDESFKKNGK
jgi:hypothetical protein